MMEGEILSLSSSSSVSSAADGQKDAVPKGESSFAQVEDRPKSADQLWYVLNFRGLERSTGYIRLMAFIQFVSL